ncbi:hypothetical protein [Variovorax paradoxus]|uniref:hypothetical protein n=1 Tax=Variovorax paradoxus TaxID=34073 RepID=UPI0027853752|nr:hypothetical protein [Variovorax paradoxus]MDQ0589295.1 hypothetical protein [Variovorax paradoxus]
MNHDPQPSGRVAQALQIHRSIAACHAYLARNDDVHALTAALMLPCYRTEFDRLSLAMSSAEKTALMSLLPADEEPLTVSLPRA